MNAPAAIADAGPLLIEKVAVRLFRVPPASKWEDATHRVPAIEIIVVELTVNGRVARGFSYTVGVGGTAVRALLHDYCSSLLLGQDARYVVANWLSLRGHLRRTGMGALTTLALAAIDVAFWELRCQQSGRPLGIEAGGGSRSVPAYSSGIDLHLTPEEIHDLLVAQCRAGYRWFKIKVGLPALDADLARVAAARAAIGGDHRLLLDANQAWDLAEAVRRCRAFEPFDPYWIEEPAPSEDIAAHAALRRKTAIPVAIGESLYSLEEFQAYLRADAVDVVQPDIARVGGLTPWLRIADLASAWARPVAPHFFAELSVHALCAIDNGLVLENVGGGSLFELGLAAAPVAIADGMATPSEASGHGVDFRLGGDNATFEVPFSGYRFDDVRSHKHG
jgi:L-alanine-DL-glutamate epimerase-like enolase superfamily enzyme